MHTGIYFMKHDALILNELKEGIFGQNLEIVKEFVTKKTIMGMRPARLHFYVKYLRYLQSYLDKPFADCQKEDIEHAVANIIRDGYADNTVCNYKTTLKVFWKAMFSVDGQEPKQVSWIHVTIKPNKNIMPSMLLNSDDVKLMIDSVDKLKAPDWFKVMFRAIIMVHFESAGRIGETLTLKIQNVELKHENYQGKEIEYARIIVDGKTGFRPIILMQSALYLRRWLELHPSGSDSLWLNRQKRPMSYYCFTNHLRQVRDFAGIQKPINTHYWRKSRISSLASKGWKESQLSTMAGWVQGSIMARVYVHMSGNDLKEKIFSEYLRDTTVF